MKNNTVHYFWYLKRELGVYLISTSHVDHQTRSALLDLLFVTALDSSSSSPFIGFTAPVIASYNYWLNDPLTGRQVTDRSDVTVTSLSPLIRDTRLLSISEWFQQEWLFLLTSGYLLFTEYSHRRTEYSIRLLGIFRCYVAIRPDLSWSCGSTRIQFIASGRTYKH